MRFWKIAVAVAVALLAAYAALRVPALLDAYQGQRHSRQEPVVDAGREKLDRRQREARATLVRDECGDDDRCSRAYWQAIKAWDACREGQVNLPAACANDYEAAIAKAKVFAGAKSGHEH
jgi:hypothetical protein